MNYNLQAKERPNRTNKKKVAVATSIAAAFSLIFALGVSPVFAADKANTEAIAAAAINDSNKKQAVAGAQLRNQLIDFEKNEQVNAAKAKIAAEKAAREKAAAEKAAAEKAAALKLAQEQAAEAERQAAALAAEQAAEAARQAQQQQYVAPAQQQYVAPAQQYAPQAPQAPQAQAPAAPAQPQMRTIHIAGAGGQAVIDQCIGPVHYTPLASVAYFIAEHDGCGGWARFSGIQIGEKINIPGVGVYTAKSRGNVPVGGNTSHVINVLGGMPPVVIQTCIPGTSQMLVIGLY